MRERIKTKGRPRAQSVNAQKYWTWLYSMHTCRHYCAQHTFWISILLVPCAIFCATFKLFLVENYTVVMVQEKWASIWIILPFYRQTCLIWTVIGRPRFNLTKPFPWSAVQNSPKFWNRTYFAITSSRFIFFHYT